MIILVGLASNSAQIHFEETSQQKLFQIQALCAGVPSIPRILIMKTLFDIKGIFRRRTILKLSNLNKEIKTHISVFVPHCLTSIQSRTEYDDNVLNNLTSSFNIYLHSISEEQMANQSKFSKEWYLDSQKHTYSIFS